MHRRVEEPAAEKAQHRVAEIAVQSRHSARLDAAGEAIADHKLAAVVEPAQEAVESEEIIAVVGIAHNDVGAARRRDAGLQRVAVALCRHGDHAGAERIGDVA